jgi:hypothetical protein
MICESLLTTTIEASVGIIDHIKCNGFDPFDKIIFQKIFKCKDGEGGSSGGKKKKGKKDD